MTGTEAWTIELFQRHPDDDPLQSVPGMTALLAWPVAVRAKADKVLAAVVAAPPPQFSGGGYWEAMHGDMGGYYELRIQGAGREQFRLFCLLERPGPGLGLEKPSIIILDGMMKPVAKLFSKTDYAKIRRLGTEFRSRTPRPIFRV